MVTDLQGLLSVEALAAVRRYHDDFVNARPFKHVVIDDFFSPEVAEGLLREFPPFDPERARNEFGRVGGKATIPYIKALGDTYARVDDLLESRSFLDWVGELTGIPSLQHDPEYFGGGTHENLEGQELDPHVDFNRHPITGSFRRLNLIVYLNKDWSDDWGGGIEIHSNPRDPAGNEIKTYSPLFNRAVIFETNEYSWHGFRRITLPPEAKGSSRKSLSVYLYTAQPPEGQVASSHATFYVQRPIAEVIKIGDVVDKGRYRELETLVKKRDDFIALYQRLEMQHNDEVERLEGRIKQWAASTFVPIAGPVAFERATSGFEADGWMLTKGQVKIRALEPLSAITVSGWLQGKDVEVVVKVTAGASSAEATVPRGESFELRVDVEVASDALQDVAIEVSDAYVPSEQEDGSTDVRALGCWISRIAFTPAESPQAESPQVESPEAESPQ